MDEEGIDFILCRSFLDDLVNAVFGRGRRGPWGGRKADFKGRNDFGGYVNGAADELPGAAVGPDVVTHGDPIGGR